MKKIHVSKVFERPDGQGRVWFNQCITVNQFPKKDAVVWESSLNKDFMYEPGTYEADTYYVNNEYTSKDGRKVKEVKIRFTNLTAVQS